MHLLEKKPAHILPLNLPVSQVKMVIVMNQVSILLVVTLCTYVLNANIWNVICYTYMNLLL